jgi:hypothetical protein
MVLMISLTKSYASLSTPYYSDLATAGPKVSHPRVFVVENEPAVNRQNKAKRLIAAQISLLRRTSIGNSAQYHYDKKHNSE